MRTTASNKKIREIISMLADGKLIPKPEFQRRLVWTNVDKDRFIDSILRNYPFPEIYLCDGEVDTSTGEGTYWLVDGLQRVSTIDEYFKGSPTLRLQTVLPYANLTEEQKREFLQYDVAVRDLGSIDKDTIVEVFKRINATKYSLNDIEINNAFFQGEFKQFAEMIAQRDFFVSANIFTNTDYKRMGDTKYVIALLAALLTGYTNRDDVMESMLASYNDAFPQKEEIEARLGSVQSLIVECGFGPKSRLWRKADLYTLIVELDRALREGVDIVPSTLVDRLESFYASVDGGERPIAAVYHKATIQASNDRINRIRRGIIIGGIILGKTDDDIAEELRAFT